MAGAESYAIEIADEATFSTPLVSETVTELEFTPLADLAAGEWHWRVRAINACGAGPWSTSRAFTVVAMPGAPALTAPADDADDLGRYAHAGLGRGRGCDDLHRAGG